MQELNIQTSNLPETDVPGRYSIEVASQHSMDVDEGVIHKLVSLILEDHSIATAEISVAVVDDSTIYKLNRQYLRHDYATDVLSFVLERDEVNASLTGEVIVSADTAIRFSNEQGIPARDELLLYVIHGALHLVGHDDKDPAKEKFMREAEKLYTDRFGIRYLRPDYDKPDKQERR